MAIGTEEYDYLEPAQATDELGRLGPYRVLAPLGKGGMGQVFRAVDTRLERAVALKVMHKRFAGATNSRKRFVHEARAMAAVKHDNVVTVYEVGETSGTPFMAMELLKGFTLERLLRDKQLLTADQIFEYATQITSGLIAAHDRGIIHRDIKPANIWVEQPGGRIKILDFGLALASTPTDTLTGRGAVVGTPGYLSPEQAQSEPIDDRSDLYSLGVVLFEMCCGRLPFIAKTIPEQLIKIIAHAPPRPDDIAKDLPRPYADIVTRLLAKEPRDRIHSARALLSSIHSTVAAVRDQSHAALTIVTATGSADSSTNDRTDAKDGRGSKPTARWIPVAGLTSLALLIFGGWFFYSRSTVASAPVHVAVSETEPAVTVASLAPLQLAEAIAAAPSIPSGQSAKFQLRLTNTAGEAKSDPRRVNAKARQVAQIRTFIKRAGEAKRPAPAFPKKIATSQLPPAGQTAVVDVLFSTGGLKPGDYEAFFELQSPSGSYVGQTTSSFLIVENLAVGELIGFETLRTGQGRGADTFVRRGSDEDFGGRSFISTHRRNADSDGVVEHAYLRFDLQTRTAPVGEIERAVLLLTLDKDALRWKSTINAYAVTDKIDENWIEKGAKHLAWATSPSAGSIESLPFLGQIEFDNSGGVEENRQDQLRFFSTALDEHVRSATQTVSILLVRTSHGDKQNRFFSREGKSESAPALAIRVK